MSGPPKLKYPRKNIAMLDHLFQELAYQGCQPLHVLQSRLFVPLVHWTLRSISSAELARNAGYLRMDHCLAVVRFLMTSASCAKGLHLKCMLPDTNKIQKFQGETSRPAISPWATRNAFTTYSYRQEHARGAFHITCLPKGAARSTLLLTMRVGCAYSFLCIPAKQPCTSKVLAVSSCQYNNDG